MQQTVSKRQEVVLQDHDMLKRFGEHFTNIITVVEQATGEHYQFRRYLLMGKWGICNAEKTRKVLDNKYISVEVLVHSQLLIGRNIDTSWDVFSLEGNFLITIPPMSLVEATNHLAKRQLS
jgi:hypothetical protein